MQSIKNEKIIKSLISLENCIINSRLIINWVILFRKNLKAFNYQNISLQSNVAEFIIARKELGLE
jgi:hypothetical protein